jgi:hypothetical protein
MTNLYDRQQVRVDECHAVHYDIAMDLLSHSQLHWNWDPGSDEGQQALFTSVANVFVDIIGVSTEFGNLADISNQVLVALSASEYPCVGASFIPASDLYDSLQAFLQSDAALKQRNFWRFYDAAAQYRVSDAFLLPQIMGRTQYVSIETAQQPYFTVGPPQRDLSSRRIRVILGCLLESIENEKVHEPSARNILHRLRDTIKQQVSRNVRWIFRPAQSTTEFRPTRTRELALAFVIRTGSSPPTVAPARPAVGRALVHTAQVRPGDSWNDSKTTSRTRSTRQASRHMCRKRLPSKHVSEYTPSSRRIVYKTLEYSGTSFGGRTLPVVWGWKSMGSGTSPLHGAPTWELTGFGSNAAERTA